MKLPTRNTLAKAGHYMATRHELDLDALDLGTDTPLWAFEYAVHELCHGELLGLGEDRSSATIGKTMSAWPVVAQEWNEALTWGAEIQVLSHFRLLGGRPFLIKHLKRQAASVGVSGVLFDRARRARHIRNVSSNVIDEVWLSCAEMQAAEKSGRWKFAFPEELQ